MISFSVRGSSSVCRTRSWICPYMLATPVSTSTANLLPVTRCTLSGTSALNCSRAGWIVAVSSRRSMRLPLGVVGDPAEEVTDAYLGAFGRRDRQHSGGLCGDVHHHLVDVDGHDRLAHSDHVARGPVPLRDFAGLGITERRQKDFVSHQ